MILFGADLAGVRSFLNRFLQLAGGFKDVGVNNTIVPVVSLDEGLARDYVHFVTMNLSVAQGTEVLLIGDGTDTDIPEGEEWEVISWFVGTTTGGRGGAGNRGGAYIKTATPVKYFGAVYGNGYLVLEAVGTTAAQINQPVGVRMRKGDVFCILATGNGADNAKYAGCVVRKYKK